MSRPVDLVVVAPHGVVGGQEMWLTQLLDATQRLTVRAVLLQDGPLRQELERRGIPVTLVPTGTRPRDLIRPIFRLVRLLRGWRPDVVLANGSKAQFVAGPAGRAAGVPVVYARHDHSLARFSPRLARWADAVVATTDEVMAPLGRSDATIILPPLPPEAALDRLAARAQLAGSGLVLPDAPVVVMATRLVPYKGVDDAIQALAKPAAARWHLWVFGGKDPSAAGEGDRLLALARHCAVADRVRLLGHRPSVSRVLSAFDALALLTKPGGPRDPGREGFGMVVLEAMASGVPVIAVRGGDIEARLGGDAGLVVAPGDPAAVAVALSQLADPYRRAACAEAGRRRVATHPTASESANRLSGVVAAAARRPGAGRPAEQPISVVVPVFNEGPAVDVIVQLLAGQLKPDDELIVVDDASSDDTPERLDRLAAQHRQLRVLRQHLNSGPSAARNTGIQAARHEFVACTDAGNSPPAHWVDAMRCALADEPAPDLVMGAYRVSDDSPTETAMGVALYPTIEDARHPGPLVRLYGRLFGRMFDPTRPAGRSVSFRRSAWTRAGGFPTNLRTGEDVAFGRCIATSGGRCVLQTDEPVTWHQHARLRATTRMYFRYGRGDGQYGERVVVTRNAIRALAALLAPWLLFRGRPMTRLAVLGGAAAYLSLPLARVRACERRWRVAAAVPLVLLLKDLAKACGCAYGLLKRRPG